MPGEMNVRHKETTVPDNSSTPQAQAPQRVIKKYPNRRLYDTSTSTYITLAQVRQLVIDGADVRVRDAKSGEDLTRAILLQMFTEVQARLADQAKTITPEMWNQFMNLQSPMMQNLMGSYIEQSHSVFQHMQEQVNKQTEQMLGAFGLNKR